MLQSGVMTRDLDVKWVSSLSWYFLNLMGLQSVFGFILGSDNGELFRGRPERFSKFLYESWKLIPLQLPAKWPSKWVWPTLRL